MPVSVGSSICGWLNFSIVPIYLLRPDQALQPHSADNPKQGRAHHWDQPLEGKTLEGEKNKESKTQIVFIFCLVLLTVGEGSGCSIFPYEFQSLSQMKGSKNFGVGGMVRSEEVFALVALWQLCAEGLLHIQRSHLSLLQRRN